MGKKITVEELKNLIDQMYAAKTEHKLMKDQAAEKWGEFLELKHSVINQLEANKMKGMEGSHCKISLKLEESFKYPSDVDDRKKVWAWLKKKFGQDYLYKKLAYNAKSFSSFVKKEVEVMEDQGDIGWVPPGVGESAMHVDLQVRKK